ncbi:MAG: sugar transferase [Anaerolineales bacterium]|nr:sugar transferase [Anaerolineales bacterium]
MERIEAGNNMQFHMPEWFEALNPSSRLITGKAYSSIKRLCDILLVLLTAPIWLVLLLLIAGLIKLTSPDGPVIFTQERTGQGGRRFRMYKFRTMVHNAEELKERYRYLNELEWPDFKISNDPRITPVGRILRRTSLDELPQMVNILKGNMSFVGPRPTSFRAENYQLWQTERLDVVPGLTGLWQITGRASLYYDQRVRLDIAYLSRRSLLLDLIIMLLTIPSVLKQRGAK